MEERSDLGEVVHRPCRLATGQRGEIEVGVGAASKVDASETGLACADDVGARVIAHEHDGLRLLAEDLREMREELWLGLLVSDLVGGHDAREVTSDPEAVELELLLGLVLVGRDPQLEPIREHWQRDEGIGIRPKVVKERLPVLSCKPLD